MEMSTLCKTNLFIGDVDILNEGREWRLALYQTW